MSEQDPNDPSELEDLLRDVSFASPPQRLDRRIDALLLPRRANWIGPLAGFAAGVIMTALVLPALSKPAGAPAQIAAAPAKSNPPAQTVYASPREVVDAINGEIDGVPVRLQHTLNELDVWPADHRAEADHDHILLVDQTTIQPVESY